MKPQNACVRLLVFALALAATASAATHEKLIHIFDGAPVEFPTSGLIADPAGNLFGVAEGAIYELSPVSGGGWRFHSLATLPGGLTDSAGGNLARDPSGHLYGATVTGGANTCGYVYELSPNLGALWSFKVLHDFTCIDGAAAGYTVILDAGGNLYGCALGGGAFNDGVVYELSPGTGGLWTYRVLHDFSSSEGNGPMTGLIFDTTGNLYGANQEAVFKLTPGSGGTWTESTAYAFNNPVDGFDPMGDLIFDPAGNLYGTNSAGGSFGSGTAFELSPSAGGGWTSTVLHTFNANNPNDGSVPFAGLIRDAAGNLYGTTIHGGGTNNAGTLFKLSLVNGAWHEIVLHRFAGAVGNDGAGPQGSLYLNSGTLYGTSPFGGSVSCIPTGGGCGTVFALR